MRKPVDKAVTQAFMQILVGMRVQKNNILSITQLLMGNYQEMDKVVTYIKENPQASESDILRVAIAVRKGEE